MEWTAPEEEHARTDIKRAPSATRRGAKDVHIGDKGLDHSHLPDADVTQRQHHNGGTDLNSQKTLPPHSFHKINEDHRQP